MSEAEGLTSGPEGRDQKRSTGGRSQNCEQHSPRLANCPPMPPSDEPGAHPSTGTAPRRTPVPCRTGRPGSWRAPVIARSSSSGTRLPDGSDLGYPLDHALGDDRLGGWPGIRRLPREHLVEHAPEGVDVGAAIYMGIAGCLLGAHVMGCAECQAGLGQPLGAGGGEGPRDAEVSQHSLPAGEQDVLGLDVTVHHAVLVGIAQRCRHVPGDAHGSSTGSCRSRARLVAKRLALDIGHDVVEEALPPCLRASPNRAAGGCGDAGARR